MRVLAPLRNHNKVQRDEEAPSTLPRQYLILSNLLQFETLFDLFHEHHQITFPRPSVRASRPLPPLVTCSTPNTRWAARQVTTLQLPTLPSVVPTRIPSPSPRRSGTRPATTPMTTQVTLLSLLDIPSLSPTILKSSKHGPHSNPRLLPLLKPAPLRFAIRSSPLLEQYEATASAPHVDHLPIFLPTTTTPVRPATSPPPVPLL